MTVSRNLIGAAAMGAMLSASGGAQASAGNDAPMAVTVENFIRAESDRYFAQLAPTGTGKLTHRRELASIDHQVVIRLNRDTLYSSGVFDLAAGPVTIVMPDSGARYMSMQVINQDHYVRAVTYGAGKYTLTRADVGTRYVAVGIRTLVDPGNPMDLKAAYALQDAVEVRQASPGRLELPRWDSASLKGARNALLQLASTMPDFRKSFGTKEEVDPVRHLMATAAAWGGLPDRDAVYLSVTPRKNDGKTVYRLDVNEVPADGFWSVSVYNAAGYYEKNPANAYTINSLTAKRNADGSASLQFGGCAEAGTNCLPIVDGWNYTVRLYRPRPEVLNGTWSFPQARAID